MDQSADLLTKGRSSPLLDALDERIAAHAEEAFTFLERLIAADSTVGREQSALEIVASELDGLGFEIERLSIPEAIADVPGAGVPLLPYDGRYDVIGRRAGDIDGTSVLLNGHIDVVPAEEPQLWTSPPFEPDRRDGWLFGRGAGDMKCGFAMGVLALRALLDPAVDAELGPLTFVAAIEEEYTGNGTLASVEAGVLADIAVLLEPTSLDLLVGGVGILWLEITVEGLAAHAEAAGGATNAMLAARPIIDSLAELERSLNAVGDPRIETAEPLHVNLGTVRAGDWTSSVPSIARLGIRVGYPPTWTVNQAESHVREHIAKVAAGDPWLKDHPPAVRQSGFRALGYGLPVDHPLTLALAESHRDAHGTEPRAIAMATTTDARTYLDRAGIPAICYGPHTARIHGIDEAVEMTSIVDGARTLARFLLAVPHRRGIAG